MKKSAKAKTMVKSSHEKDWTEPPYLSKQDSEDLKTVKRLYEKGKFKEALQFASDLDTAVRDEIPVAIWKEIGGELTESGEEELRRQQKGESQETDYSDEFSTLKELHEDNIGKKFTDEEFNEIFSVAEKMQPNLSKHADRFQNDMMGLLMTLEEATHKWGEEKLVKDVKGNPKEEINKMIGDLIKVIEHYASEKNPNWGTVGTLSNIHESLGKQLYEKYDKHLEYSRSVEEGIKRHSEAAKDLLLQATDEVKNLDSKKHLPDIIRLRNFFKDLLEGFQGVLHTMEEKKNTSSKKRYVVVSINEWKEISVLTKPVNYYMAFEMRKDFQQKFGGEHQIIDAIPYEKGDGFSNDAERIEITKVTVTKLKGNWIWEIVFNRHDSAGKFIGTYTFEAEEFRQILQERGFKMEKETSEMKPEEKPTQKLSLKEEAIELARKLGDKELAKYLENVPLKTIQRRIQALREEVEIFSKRKK